MLTPADMPPVTAELRDLFRSGASVAKLFQHVRDRLGETATNLECGILLRSAFGLGPAGWYLTSYTESFGNGTEPDWKLTRCFLSMILENRAEWDISYDESTWYDALSMTPPTERHELAATTHGVTREGWEKLTESDRKTIQSIESSRLKLGDEGVIFAALIEQLQRRVNELELRMATPMMAGTHS